MQLRFFGNMARVSSNIRHILSASASKAKNVAPATQLAGRLTEFGIETRNSQSEKSRSSGAIPASSSFTHSLWAMSSELRHGWYHPADIDHHGRVDRPSAGIEHHDRRAGGHRARHAPPRGSAPPGPRGIEHRGPEPQAGWIVRPPASSTTTAAPEAIEHATLRPEVQHHLATRHRASRGPWSLTLVGSSVPPASSFAEQGDGLIEHLL